MTADHVNGAPRAATVRDVEMTRPIDSIAGRDDAGCRIEKAALLVRVHDEPVGTLMLPVADGGLPSETIVAAAESEYGAAIRRRLAATPSAIDRRSRAVACGPAITVVICTRDHPDSLARTIDSVLAQEYQRFRVLVVDNAPVDDATLRVTNAAAKLGPVTRLAVPEPGLSNARNAALAACPGEILAWIDDDAIADRHWLSEIAAAALAEPDASVICGSVTPAELDTPAQLLFEEFGGLVKQRGFEPDRFDRRSAARQSPLYPLPPFGAGTNMVTMPGVMERVGGFDPALGAGTPTRGGEDTLAFTSVLLAGGTIVYHPAALVRHFHRRRMDDLRNQLYGYGLGVTAFYTALAIRRPSSLLALAGLAPRAARDVLSARGRRHRDLTSDFPVELKNAGRRGMLRGPAAYLRSRGQARRNMMGASAAPASACALAGDAAGTRKVSR